MLKCESLESTQIGENCFSDHAGDSELEYVPKLQFIQVELVGE